MTVLLQDTDALTPANWSTQLLTRLTNVGAKKTRCMAGLCEVRGFRTVIVERPFGAPFRLGPEDLVALCGVDNLTARRELDSPGFTRVIEAGLGHEGEEHLDFQLHGFPGSRTPGDVWGPEQAPFAEGLLELPAYRHLRNGGADECGLTQVAGLAVGVPFVGAFVSSLVVAETVRAVAMQHTYEVMDGTLWSLHHLRAARCRTQMQENVGFLEAKAERSRRRRMGSGAQAADADLP